MSMKDRILSILRSPEAARIRFTVSTSTGKVTIGKTAFDLVASAIVSGKIQVTTTQTLEPGVAAEYDSKAIPGAASGELRTPPVLGREQEGMVLHECTHAYFDLTRNAFKATEEEAVCYVVNTLYFRMTGLTSSRWTNEPHATAKAVADGVLRKYAAGKTAVPELDAGPWYSLVLVVALNDNYLTGTAGLPRWFSGVDNYTNDG